MSDASDKLNRPPPDDTDESPTLPEPLRPTEKALADALANLAPAPAKIDRDRIMFEAGVVSRVGTIRLWQATAGFLAAVGFAAGMLVKPATIIERVVYIDAAHDEPNVPGAAIHPTAPFDPSSPAKTGTMTGSDDGRDEITHWFQLRNEVLSVGIEALPECGPKFGPVTAEPGPLEPK